MTARVRLCAKGGCRATPKGTHHPPLPLFGPRPHSVEIERDAPRPSRPAHARERSTRRRRANGGKRERPRKSERRRRYSSLANTRGNAPHPFACPAPNPRATRKVGGTEGSALPPLRVSTTPRAVVRARPLCAPPFGCHARAVPHAGWRLQGGFRMVGRARAMHARRRAGSCSHPFPCNGDV